MADENVQTTEQAKPVESSEFDLSKFNFNFDDNTGELIVEKPEVKVDEKKVEENTEGQQVPDKFVELETKFGNQFAVMQDMIAKQSNAIGLLLQAQTKALQPEQESLGEEQDKLVETITNKVKQQIAPIQQQVSNQQLESQIATELQQLQMRFPDAIEYFPGMSYLQTTMSHHPWTANELYFLAKGMNLKQQKQENKDNIINIDEKRNLPNKVSSVNSQLKTKEIRPGKAGIRDAMEAAMEELGFGT